uniref:DUF753 domain-containing protein n=1 Tax=Ceratitis capitata TaxID=7213 RepID=W8B9Q5_CERCA
MKAIIWFIYISSIVILFVQADVQDNDHTEICSKCADASLPRCESTDEERLDKKVDCQLERCVVGLDTETNYICLMEFQSPESSIQESKGDGIEITVQPVPIALQMVPTTESSKDISKEINGETVEQLQSNAQNTEHNAALETESDVEELDKTPEKVEETQTEESEHKEEQAAAVSEDKVPPAQENLAESPEIPETSDAAVAEMPLTADGDTINTANSPDYAADAPAKEDSESQLPEEQPESAAPEGDKKAEQTETENMSDTHEEGAAVNEKPEINDGETADTDNTDNEANIGTQIQITNAEGDDVISEPADNMTDQPPIAAATGNSLPVNADKSLSCFSCTSSEDTKCAKGPGRAINCPAMENKQNGCYTLYKADTNITTRGCISELTTEGLKYCKSNTKKCFLCYDKGCNNLLAPSTASRNIGAFSFCLGIGSLIFIKIMIN